MAKTLWNESDRLELLGRVERLRPDMHPVWGKMSAMEMMSHLTEWMRMASGELKLEPRRKFIRYPGIKHLIIYWLPWPKGVPTAPELLARKASGWKDERKVFSTRLRTFGKLKSKTEWPPHPAFGKMSEKSWGVLGYRHTDHHLRQFGV